MRHFSGLMLAALLLLAVSNGSPSATPFAVGSAAPPFHATALLDGKVVGLGNFTGKVLVLNFWATWCPPCRAETPAMIRAYSQLKAPDVAFLGIDTTETAPVVKTFVALKGLQYPVALAGPAMYNAYRIAYIPTTIVIDPHGIVRARWTGGVTPMQLADYVANARRQRNSFYVTAEQRSVDAMLALSQFRFTGSRTTVAAEVLRANERLAQVNAYELKLDAGGTLRFDPERTQHEIGALEFAEARALSTAAGTPKQRIAADELLGQADVDLNRLADAVKADRDALAIEPNDPELLGALTLAYYRRHFYGAMAQTAQHWTNVAPQDSDAWDQLGLANQRQQRFQAAVPPYVKALALMKAAAKTQPIGKNGDAVADVADESLDLANVYVSLGDATDARRVFDQARRYAALIPAASDAAELKTNVPQRIIEGMTAVALAHGTRTRLALTKWSGANLPGSLASTFRYRLVIVAPAGKRVTLGTKGLESGWIASFCQDRLCSPNRVTFTMPATGLKSYEFQLVPPQPHATTGPVSVGAADSNWVSTQ